MFDRLSSRIDAPEYYLLVEHVAHKQSDGRGLVSIKAISVTQTNRSSLHSTSVLLTSNESPCLSKIAAH